MARLDQIFFKISESFHGTPRPTMYPIPIPYSLYDSMSIYGPMGYQRTLYNISIGSYFLLNPLAPAQPPSKVLEIFCCTCLQSNLQTSTPTAKNSYPKFQTPRTAFEMLTWQPFCNKAVHTLNSD
jgi:hypothetical protein